MEQRIERRIGVYICHCGTNISGTVDVEKVAEFAKAIGYEVPTKQGMVVNQLLEF